MNEICSPVVSSRIRLARNLKKYAFPMMLSEAESGQVIQEIAEVFSEETLREAFDIKILKDMDPLTRQEMVESHLMSPNLLNMHKKGALIISKDKSVSIMLNEEDHLRIQCIEKGFDIDKAFELANEIDNKLEEKLEYAFDEKLGYLTSCVTNVGTGLRASVMMHLPALRMIGEIKKIVQTLSKIGLTVRGGYGEGSEALGNMFQISNQITLGASEKEIIGAVHNIITQLIEKERNARRLLMEKDPLLIEDKVYRSYGVLKNARLLNYKECMMLLSDVILGADLGIITEISNSTLHHIMNAIQPASLQLIFDKNFDGRERDVKRAEYIVDLLG